MKMTFIWKLVNKVRNFRRATVVNNNATVATHVSETDTKAATGGNAGQRESGIFPDHRSDSDGSCGNEPFFLNLKGNIKYLYISHKTSASKTKMAA